MPSAASNAVRTVKSLIPARLDRLPWARFHWMIVVGLGVSWILDGLEIQIVSQNGFSHEFGMSSAEVGATGTIYLVGQVVGALVFGRLSDRLGRRRLFILTLLIYLGGSALAGLVPGPSVIGHWPTLILFWLFRFIAGAGIGGEYSAINSAIDELIPSHYRGHVDIAINGTYWGGAALGATANFFFLNTDLLGTDFVNNWAGGSRSSSARSSAWPSSTFGGTSPRVRVGRSLTATRRRRTRPSTRSRRSSTAQGHKLEAVPDSKAIEISPQEFVPFHILARVFFKMYPKRTIVGATMMITQSFLYNAIFFSYALALTNFYGVKQTSVYFFPFAIGNLLGPLLLGRLFDSWGRRKMILLTYGGSGVILAVSAAPVPGERPDRGDAGDLLVRCVLLRVGRSIQRVSDRQRDLPAGGARAGDLVLLLTGPDLRVGRAAALRHPDRRRQRSRTRSRSGTSSAPALMIIGGVVTFILGTDAERKQLEAITDPITVIHREEAAEAAREKK